MTNSEKGIQQAKENMARIEAMIEQMKPKVSLQEKIAKMHEEFQEKCQVAYEAEVELLKVEISNWLTSVGGGSCEFNYSMGVCWFNFTFVRMGETIELSYYKKSDLSNGDVISATMPDECSLFGALNIAVHNGLLKITEVETHKDGEDTYFSMIVPKCIEDFMDVVNQEEVEQNISFDYFTVTI